MKIRSLSFLPALALVSLLGNAVIAAPPAAPANKPGANGRRPGGPMRGMSRIAKELGLTEAQKQKLGTIMRSSMPAFRAIRENTKLTPDQKRAKTKSLREQNEKKMKAVLTPTQRTKFDTLMKERRNRMRNMRQDKRA